MYYWEERHSDILACAPRPRVARSTTKNHPRCLCHGQRWANATRGVIEALAKTQQQHLGAPPDAGKVIQKQMCCCGNKLVNTGLNLPTELIEQEIWDIHTFFLNLLNNGRDVDVILTPDMPIQSETTTQETCDKTSQLPDGSTSAQELDVTKTLPEVCDPSGESESPAITEPNSAATQDHNEDWSESLETCSNTVNSDDIVWTDVVDLTNEDWSSAPQVISAQKEAWPTPNNEPSTPDVVPTPAPCEDTTSPTMKKLLSKLVQDCLIHKDESRFFLLQQLRYLLKYGLLDMQDLVQQAALTEQAALLHQHAKHEENRQDSRAENKSEQDTQQKTDSHLRILDMFYPNIIDWLEAIVMKVETDSEEKSQH